LSQSANGWKVTDDGSTQRVETNPAGRKFVSPWLHVILLGGFPESVGHPDFDPHKDPGNSDDFRMIFAKVACDLLDVQDLDHDEWSYPLNDTEVIRDTR
jgi:hypothetical protein